MSYNLFIDDERFPPDDGKTWVIVRTSDDACRYVKEQGFPRFISFDHDLGGDSDIAMKFLHKIADDLCDEVLIIPEGFSFYVHSQNPVGAENIRQYMNCLLLEFGNN